MGAAGNVEPKVYRIDASGYIFAAMTLVFTIFGLALLLPQTLAERPEELPFMLMWFAVLAWFWFNVLTSPYEVRMEADGRIVFRSLVRRREVHASQIRRVKGLPLHGGIQFTHDGGRIWLRVPLRSFYDFLIRLRELNPGIDTTGV